MSSEIDARVACGVMGFEVCHSGETPAFCEGREYSFEYYSVGPEGEKKVYALPNYSTDMNAAMEVVEKMRETWVGFKLCYEGLGQWSAFFQTPKKYSGTRGRPTRPPSPSASPRWRRLIMGDKKTTAPANGDYVLATKYNDGDPNDHWVVGFYDRQKDDRHLVVDAEGKQFRANGFRRVSKISKERGLFILANRKWIEIGARSLWWWKRCKM